MLYEYILENGVWKLYWGGKIGRPATSTPLERGATANRTVVGRTEAETPARDEPVLVIQA